MVRAPLSERRRITLGVCAVLIVMVLYSALSWYVHLENAADRIVPTWPQIGDGVLRIVRVDADDHVRYLVVDARATGWRLLTGFGLSALIGFGLGVIMGCFRNIRAVLLPIIAAIARVPPTAVIAVLMVMAGTGMGFYHLIIAVGIVPILAESVTIAVDDIPQELIEKAYTLGASRWEVVWNVIVPEILPKALDVVRLQLPYALVYLIAGELLTAEMGFGCRIRRFARLAQMDIVFPYLIVLATFGFFMDWALIQLRRSWCPWYQPQREVHHA